MEPQWLSSPEGIEKRGKDYVAKNGFGHEEWNANPDRMWRGQKIFYTNATENLTEYGAHGELGIVMTSYNNGIPYALGVATSVRANTETEKVEIARALSIDAEAKYVWDLPSVRKRHPKWQEFKRFWDGDASSSLIWRCPPPQFHWFSNPIPTPLKVTRASLANRAFAV